MKTALLVLPMIAALLAGCETSGQAQTAEGEVQMPGAHAAVTPLNAPPDEWAGPPRQTAQALEPESTR